MSKTNAKKASPSKKQAQQKLTRLVRGLSSVKTQVAASSQVRGSCSKMMYCV